MNCADARHLIHLDVGGDLVSSEEHQLAEHLERCAECRSYNAGMVKSMQALHVLRDFDSVAAPAMKGGAETAVNGGSAWSTIAARLPVRQRQPVSMRQFNIRVAALCACSLVLAMVTIIQNLPSSGFSRMSDPGGELLYGQFSQRSLPLSPPQGMPASFRPLSATDSSDQRGSVSGEPVFAPGNPLQFLPSGSINPGFQALPRVLSADPLRNAASY